MKSTSIDYIRNMIVEDFDDKEFENCYQFFDYAESLGYSVHSGASRTTLYKEEFGKRVVKLSFGEDEDYGFSFCENYFELENQIYDAAADNEKQDLSPFFLPNTYIGHFTIDAYNWEDEEWGYVDIQMWVQDRVDEVWKSRKNCYSEKNYCKERKVSYILEERGSCFYDTPIYGTFRYALIRKYGIETASALSEFCETHCSDLHFGNCGVLNGNLVFFDYAGYWG